MYKGLREAKNARVVYLDMNSFFASIEQQRHPELRGKPVAVVSHIGPAGAVLAASYEAKAFGVRTGMRLKDAWPLCSTLLARETGFAAYRATHLQFMEILRDLFGPEVQARSVDEAVMFMPPNWQSSEQAWQLAGRIKKRFREELGTYIRCSIGIAPNSLLAKLATDLQKPDGLVEITLENTREILATIPLTDLPGIAEKNAAHLQGWDINTPAEFYDVPAAVLRQRFGIWGQYWWWRLHGYEADSHSGPLKSMSHQHALKNWTQQRNELLNTFYRMADRLIHRLCRNGFQCQQAFVYIRLKGQPGFAADGHFPIPTNNYVELLDGLVRLFHELPETVPAPIRMISLGFNQLIPAQSGWQMDLFHTSDRQQELSRALEKVRARHGFEAIQRGNVIRLDSKIAKETVGFGRVKDI